MTIVARSLRLAVLSLAVGWQVMGCHTLITPAPAATGTTAELIAVQAKYESQLMALQGVVGVGIGECEGQPCLKVLVAELTPALERALPNQLDGFKVESEVTGFIQPLPLGTSSAEPSHSSTATP